MWTDAYLTWSKEDYDGLDTIRIPSRLVWKPDIVLYNRWLGALHRPAYFHRGKHVLLAFLA